MAKRKKTITAGRLVIGTAYTVATLQDGPKARADKTQMSSAARDLINLRYSWQKLEVLLAANYTKRDLFVTLTYDDDHIPANRAEGVKRVKKFLTTLRAARRKRGQDLTYIYVTEQLSAEGGRLHHHLVINGTGDDYETIRSLWPWGDMVDIEPLDVGGNDNGYADLAKYLTKEPRELGKCEVGARTWVPSLGLIRPEPLIKELEDNDTITAPPGAYVLDVRGPIQCGYGEYTYIKYLLPVSEERKKLPWPPRRRTKK